MGYGFAIKVTGGAIARGWLTKNPNGKGFRVSTLDDADGAGAAYHLTEERGRQWLADLHAQHPKVTFELWALEDMRLIATAGPARQEKTR